MLAITDTRQAHHCQGWTRRDFLRIGALGFGSLSFPGLTPAAAATNGTTLQGKSVVLLFLQGGPPHIEFFDPKMTAPSEIRSITGEVKTSLPGVTFGATFPKLAKLAERIAVVRNYGSGNSDHVYGAVVSGGSVTGPSMGAIHARVRGTNDPQTGMPTNVLVLPEAVSDGLKLDSNFETGALSTLTQAGSLGQAYAAFNPSGGGDLKNDMELKIPRNRLADRRSLLHELDALRRRVDASGVFDNLAAYEQQAFDVITRGVDKAFDLSQEDARTIERYDTSKLFDMRELTRWYDMRRATNMLGRQMLLARRLCEAGAGFVTVSDCGWDYHANENSPKYMAGIHPMGGQVDHAVSAFIEDVRERGLEDKILLIVTGEMGRTPRINKDGGRDHYGELTTLLLFGGGLRMGQIIGQSDSQAGKAIGRPYRPSNLLSTVMHVLFDLGELRLVRGLPREIVQVIENGSPIGPLFSG